MEIIPIKKWLVFGAANLINICLGSIYGWSVFAAQLKVENPTWLNSEISAIFSITIFCYAFTAIIAGIIQDKIGPRWVATFGGICLGTGIIMSSMATTVSELYLWHGVVAGVGIGSAYVTPLAAVLKWFPEKKGLMGGIVMGVFGAGGLVFAPLAGYIISQTGHVSSAFFTLGIIYLLVVTVSAQFLINPPDHYLDYLKTEENINAFGRDFTPAEMLKTPVFYVAWIVFILGAISGLVYMSNAQEVAQVFLGLSVSAAISIVGIVSIFNALGSPVFGWIADRLGGKLSLIILLSMCALALFLLPKTSSYLTFLIISSIVMLCYGGVFGIFPTIIAGFYGNKYLGTNYGLFFVGYGLAAIIGPRMAATFLDAARFNAINGKLGEEGMRLALSLGYSKAFLIAALCCIVAIGLTLLLKPPFKEQSTSEISIDKALE